ncbi:GNAT family N-acetyltransferase [Microbacterium thalassium]|uniref:GNAT superfamily N-acetyltransferase n=1 Tax=Microbacterium thalassium TaxID=362649 RepID=A0A7X0KW16_9MICO|nr:GNAT family N-acetyltransferase [Microbacterium thalassium]MBB6392807.1 GNAT superfamily N-acetyltransferase [Microbacterium thalassium]GLK22962.1 N-acetyltransferase [Microbacterium thalassium]
MAVTIRRAVKADAAAISRIRVDTWRAAYAGLVLPEVLERLDAEREAVRRADTWDQLHSDPRNISLLAEDGGSPVGWAAYGPSLDPERPGSGQVYALYAIAERWSTGVGHALLAACEDGLRSQGFTEAHLWVLEGNTRAEDFYARHGWSEDGAILVDDRTVDGIVAYALRERRRVRDLTEVAADRG